MYAPIVYDIDTETYTGPKKPDMPLYASKKTVPSLKILVEMFDHFIVRLGGMHTLMSFAGAIGTLMGGSGLIEIKTTTLEHAAIIPDILAAHALSRCDTTACYFGIGKGTVI